MKKSEERVVYIVLTHTGTIPSRLIRIFTRYEYTHVSISLDRNLEHLYSFARKAKYNFFNAGFVEENFNTGVYGRLKHVKCKIYKIRLDNKKYERICKILKKYKNRHYLLRYNFLGILCPVFKKSFSRKNYFFCSQFVTRVLIDSRILKIHEDPSIISPGVLDKKLSIKTDKVYEGLLKSIDIDKIAIS